jgi:hypothetical protein
VVLFERHHQAVCGGAGQTARLLQIGQVERMLPKCLQDGHALVDHADAAYTVHIQECYPK